VYRILGQRSCHPETRKSMVLVSGSATDIAGRNGNSLDIADIA
jgi:hypothetical protein